MSVHRNPDNPADLAWLLGKIRDHDVDRNPETFRYRLFVDDRRDPAATVDCTDRVEALSEPTRDGRGAVTPPLVRLLRNGLVELTADGQARLDRELGKITRRSARDSARRADRKAAAPVFQPATAA